MNIKNRSKSIEAKTLLYILAFNVGMIILFWCCEVIFFDVFYKNYKSNQVKSVANSILNANEDVYVLAEKMAYKNEVCISVVNDNFVSYNFNTMKVGCELNNNNELVSKKMNEFYKSEDSFKSYRIYGKNEGLLYGVKAQNKTIFIYDTVNNISASYRLFTKQLIYFIFIAILVSVLISIFIASNVTKPIKMITKKSRKIGKGNYDIMFPRNGINEIDELSETLENVQKELRKTDEIKRDLMANVSHDLKTPLTMIKAYAEMIKDISYKDQKKMAEHLNIIMEETDRLTVLVNDILELSRTQNDALMYNMSEFDLIKEIKKIIKRYEVIKETENYKFILELPRKAIIKADKDKISQVIYNLVNNAINYTGDDKVVKIRVTKEKSYILVEIIDTGKGIKKEEIPYIWDKYYKSEKNHQRNVVSIGLGLSIVKEILSRHKFEYGVKSSNKGSTFYFKINI